MTCWTKKMNFLKISEPGMVSHKKKLSVGIDLGTTNSLVATVRSDVVYTVPDHDGNYILPSIVRYTNTGVEVGEVAKSHVIDDSLNTIVLIKRLMGRGLKDFKTLGNIMPYHFSQSESGMPFIDTRQGSVSPVEISAEILRTLSKRARLILGGDLDGVVITVPAYFDEAQRQATKDAAKLAGLHVYRLLNEPTAAAIAYGLNAGNEGVIAIYDLGGGTFDISILRLHNGIFEVIATGGDTALGGNDFDKAIARWILKKADVKESTLDSSSHRAVMVEGCRAKESLTSFELVNVSFADWQGELNRSQFNELIEPLVTKTIQLFKQTLHDAEIKIRDVQEVVMVGGSTRMPCILNAVSVFFRKRLLTSIDPDRVVAIGAAQQANILAGNQSANNKILLLDVIPLSLGLETMGGLVEKIIHRNTTIPISCAQEFTTYKNAQTNIAIHVLQGESALVNENRSLARFELKGIPPLPAGIPKIKITFQVDADGLLDVSAEELSTGVKKNLLIQPSYGLTENEIRSILLKDSCANTTNDLNTMKLYKQEVEYLSNT